jgi:DNA polymerase-1
LVNAVYGFLLVFFKTIKDFHPEFIAACFDARGKTFRHKKFEKYKAKRPPAPENLYSQIPKVKEVLKVFKVPVFEKEGFEADDLIGTIANQAPKKQVLPAIETIILSGDLDNLQLVNAKTRVYFLKKGVKDVVLYDEKSVEQRYQGLKPGQLTDFRALRGDPSDNIPGVTGIGEKTAQELLLEFENLDNLYREIEEGSERIKALKPRVKDLLIKYKEQAFISKQLAQIEKSVPIEFNLKKCRWEGYSREEAAKTLRDFDFHSLVQKLPEIKGKEKNEVIGENLKLW